MNRMGIEMTVTVERKKLLEKLRENQERHSKIVKEAFEGYKFKAVEALRSKLDEFASGKMVFLQFNLAPPQDQTAAYDTAIKMLEWSKDDEIELEAGEFRRYVMDEWDWRDSFLVTNAFYSKAASVYAAELGTSTEKAW